MKNSLLLFLPYLLAGSLILIVGNNAERPASFTSRKPVPADIIACSPGGGENIYLDSEGKFIRILPGWGDHAYKINTQNDSAQVYFNQGLSMYYSYHSREAT